MKLVLSPDQVAHKWANQLQTEARNSGSTLFFDHDSIYSYGRHFCIAKHVQNPVTKESATLFTTRGYSPTTQRHISIVRQASRHLNRIYCNDPSESPRLNLAAFHKQIKSHLAGLARAKKPEKYINPAEEVFEQAKDYARFFSIELPQSIIDLISAAKTGEYKNYLIEEADRIAKEKEAIRVHILKEDKKKLAKWRKGEGDRLTLREDDRDYLRINKKGRVETSQAIEIPVELAKRIYKQLVRIIKSGGCGVGNQIDCELKILDYSVKEITKDYIKVGCHTIDIKEINKMAKQIGII